MYFISEINFVFSIQSYFFFNVVEPKNREDKGLSEK